MKKATILPILFVLCISFAFAQTYSCPVQAKAKNIAAFLNEIPDLNDAGKNCPATLQGAVSKLAGNGIIQVNIAMNSGSTESFFMVKSGDQITEITTTKQAFYHYLVETDETSADMLLQSKDRFTTFSWLYQQKKIKISGGKFLSRVRLFFTKPIISFVTNKNQGSVPPPTPLPQGSWGKPDNCDDTFLPGHNGYQQNQAVWDDYSANTDGVCQSQFGRGVPSPCVYTVQLSVSGNPYYLCWYNN